ncbi:MAG TPA: ATP synthase subunit I [Pyrinomonadaceae bacterium]
MNEIADNAGTGAFAYGEGAALERRLLRGMCVAVALSVLVSLPLAPWRVTTGLLLGGILSFFNHHWLRTSLAAVFNGAGHGSRVKGSRLVAARYVLRYLVVALVVAAAYVFNLVSIGATIAGLCSFVVAVMFEALTQLYFAIVYREEN